MDEPSTIDDTFNRMSKKELMEKYEEGKEMIFGEIQELNKERIILLKFLRVIQLFLENAYLDLNNDMHKLLFIRTIAKDMRRTDPSKDNTKFLIIKEIVSNCMAFKNSPVLLRNTLNSLEEIWKEKFTFNKDDILNSVLLWVATNFDGWQPINDMTCERGRYFYENGEDIFEREFEPQFIQLTIDEEIQTEDLINEEISNEDNLNEDDQNENMLIDLHLVLSGYCEFDNNLSPNSY